MENIWIYGFKIINLYITLMMNLRWNGCYVVFQGEVHHFIWNNPQTIFVTFKWLFCMKHLSTAPLFSTLKAYSNSKKQNIKLIFFVCFLCVVFFFPSYRCSHQRCLLLKLVWCMTFSVNFLYSAWLHNWPIPWHWCRHTVLIMLVER